MPTTINHSDSADSLISSMVGRWVPWLALVVVFYYQVHRYVLNFDAGVDPTFGWKVGKYVSILMLCLVGLLIRWRSIFPLDKFDLLWTATFAGSAIVGFLSRSPDLIECAFWALAAWLIAKISLPLSLQWLRRWCFVALLVQLMMIVSQAIGLIYFGKLFAHANPNVWLSRFGGLTVEPLSATMLGLFFAGVGFSFQGWKRWGVIALGILFVIACHTWTGYVYLLILFALACIAYLRRHPKWVVLAIAFSVLLAWFVLGSGKLNLAELYEAKRPSIELHMTYWWPDVWRIWPSTTYDFNETWWVNGVENMGVIWTIAYHVAIFYLLLIVWKKYQDYRSTERGWIYLTTLIMGGYFLFGSLNLPYPVIYPANFLFLLFAMFCYFDRFNGLDAVS